jgi:hypothetical protein
MAEIEEFISKTGFPIFIACFMVFAFYSSNKNIIVQLTTMNDKLDQIIKHWKGV